jgi:NAD(P)H-dependent FMN reductase
VLKHWTEPFDEVDVTQYGPDPFVGVAAFTADGMVSVTPPTNATIPSSFVNLLKFLM